MPTNLNPPASVFRRISTMVYEFILLISISFIPILIGGVIATIKTPEHILVSIVTTTGLLFVWQLYFRYAWLKTGQTLPMKIWQLRLETEQGKLLSKKQSWLRFIWATVFICVVPALSYTVFRKLNIPAFYSFMLSILWWILPIGYAFFDSDKQFLYDRINKTRIVRLPKNK